MITKCATYEMGGPCGGKDDMRWEEGDHGGGKDDTSWEKGDMVGERWWNWCLVCGETANGSIMGECQKEAYPKNISHLFRPNFILIVCLITFPKKLCAVSFLKFIYFYKNELCPMRYIYISKSFSVSPISLKKKASSTVTKYISFKR